MKIDVSEKIRDLTMIESLLEINAEIVAIKKILCDNNITTEDNLENLKKNYMEESGTNKMLDDIGTKLKSYKELQDNPKDYINNHIDELTDDLIKADPTITKELATEYLEFLSKSYGSENFDDPFGSLFGSIFNM